MLFKMAEGLMPALPPEHFLTASSKDRRKMTATTYHNCNSDNAIIRQSANNNSGYIVPVQARQNSLGAPFLSGPNSM